MDTALPDTGAAAEASHRHRQFRWFRTSFRHDAALISERFGVDLAVDDARLAEAYRDWADLFATQKRFGLRGRQEIAFHAAGLMLRALLRARPVATTEGRGGSREPVSGAVPHARSEGFVYTNYCLCLLGAVLEQEGQRVEVAELADDLRHWLAFRRDRRNDPAAAIAFLDLFTGHAPTWWMPDAMLSRAALKRARAARVLPLGEPAEAV